MDFRQIMAAMAPPPGVPKTLTEIRSMVAELHEGLGKVVALHPVPGHWFRTIGGQICLVGTKENDGCLHAYFPATDERKSVSWKGDPWHNDLGTFLTQPLKDWCILVEDLGPAQQFLRPGEVTQGGAAEEWDESTRWTVAE